MSIAIGTISNLPSDWIAALSGFDGEPRVGEAAVIACDPPMGNRDLVIIVSQTCLEARRMIAAVRATGSRALLLILIGRSYPHPNMPLALAECMKIGADDAQPILSLQPGELRARAEALLRREQADDTLFEIGNTTIRGMSDPLIGGSAVRVPPKELLILRAFFERPGRIFSKEALMEEAYGPSDDQPQIKIIDVFLCKLRRRIRMARGFAITTVWGEGYRLDIDQDPAP